MLTILITAVANPQHRVRGNAQVTGCQLPNEEAVADGDCELQLHLPAWRLEATNLVYMVETALIPV